MVQPYKNEKNYLLIGGGSWGWEGHMGITFGSLTLTLNLKSKTLNPES